MSPESLLIPRCQDTAANLRSDSSPTSQPSAASPGGGKAPPGTVPPPVTLYTRVQESAGWDVSRLVLELDTKEAELVVLHSVLDTKEAELVVVQSVLSEREATLRVCVFVDILADRWFCR